MPISTDPKIEIHISNVYLICIRKSNIFYASYLLINGYSCPIYAEPVWFSGYRRLKFVLRNSWWND